VSVLRHFSPVRAGGAVLLAATMVAGPAITLPSESASQTGQRPVAQESTASVEAEATLMVIGDSIARAYDDKPGSVRQGFWSMIADEIQAQPKMAAQGGAGFVKPGLSRCKGRTFTQQLERPKIRNLVERAGVLIIEGGRNDTRTCHRRGFADVTTEQLEAAVDGFMNQVAALRAESEGCTLVVTPWGPKGQRQRSRITPVIREAARSHGFDFIGTTGVLNRQNTIDGIHPERAGNEALTREILRRGFARTCFSSGAVSAASKTSVVDRPVKSGQRRFPV
jgi:lysophospholipase L1-like esterase